MWMTARVQGWAPIGHCLSVWMLIVIVKVMVILLGLQQIELNSSASPNMAPSGARDAKNNGKSHACAT